jgi:hypothetical protein
MESNDKAGIPDVTEPGSTTNIPDDTIVPASPVALEVPTAVEAGNSQHPIEPVDKAARDAEDRRRAEELADSLEPRTKKRGPVGDTPFDKDAATSPSKINWGGLGFAFFGGLGANFYLGILLAFLEKLVGSVVYGPGVIAILTGLFVVLQLLVPFSLDIRRMTIAFWAGLLCGYAVIWMVVSPILQTPSR